MGYYVSYEREDIILESIFSFINEKKLSKASEGKGSKQTEVKARGKTGKIHYESAWNIESLGDLNSIRMEVRPDGKLHKILNLKFIFLVLIIPFTLLTVRLFGNPDNYNKIFLVGMVLFLLAAFNFLSTQKIMRALVNEERDFKRFLDRNITLKINSPPEGKILPQLLTVPGLFIMVATLLYAISRFQFIFLLALLFFSYIFLLIILVVIGKNEKILVWKAFLILNVLRWMMVTGSVILLIACLYLLNLMAVQNYQTKVEGKNVNYFSGTLAKPLFFTGNFRTPESKVRLAEEHAEKNYEEMSGEEAAKTREVYVRNVLLKYGTGFAVVILILFVYFIITVAGLFSLPPTWKVLMTMGMPVAFRPPAIGFRSKVMTSVFYFVFAVLVLVSLPINYLFAAIGLDSLHYLFTNDTLILKGMSSIFSWIPASLMMIGKGLNLNNPDLLLPLSWVILLLISLPVLYFLIRWFLIFSRNLTRRAGIKLSDKESDRDMLSELREMVSELADEGKVRIPKIQLTDSSAETISSRIGLFSSRATIEINKNVFNVLNEKELRAVISHELGHIKQGLKRIALLKFLSRIAMFPNFFLTIPLDYRKIEDRADKFAIKTTGDREALKTALNKLAVMSQVDKMSAREGKKGKKTKLLGWIKNLKKKFLILDDFLFGEALIGYSHPSIMERIKGIEKE